MKAKNIFVSVFFLMLVGFSYTIDLSNKSGKEINIILNSMIETNKPPKEIFKSYYALYKKTYDLNSQEGLKRYKIFKSNMKWNKEKNDELGKQLYGITHFMDITDEEFKKYHLMDPVLMEKHIGSKGAKKFKNNLNKKEKSTPQIDWRSLYVNNPAKNQETCGSCWSFAANGAIEGNFKKQFNTEKKLSNQYLLDCDTVDAGCNG
jgi:cathepsin F